MARIPMGNFGQSMPQVEQTNLPRDQSGQMIANSLNNIQQYAQNSDQEQRDREVSAKRLELYNNELDKKDGQLKVDELLTTGFSNKVADLKNQVGNGALSSQQAQEQLKTWSDEQFNQLKPNLPYFAHKDYQGYWDANVNKSSSSFFPLQLKANEQKDLLLSDRAQSIATRLPRDQGRQYLGDFLEKSGIPEAKKQSMMIDYEQSRDKTELESGIEQAFASGDAQALQNVAASIKDKKYIDGATAQHFSQSITSKLSTLQQRAEMQEQKRQNEAGKVFNNFKSAVLTGSALGEELISDTATAVKGTPYEADFTFYQKQSKNFQDFAKLSTSEQLNRINDYKVQQKNRKSNDPEAENKILSVYQSLYSDKLKTIKDNPSLSIQEKGIKLPDLNAAEMKMNPASFIDKVSTIGAYQVAARDKDANATIKPISPDVLPEAKKAFDEMGVNQKLDFIGGLINKTKNMKNGSSIWGATLGQLNDGNSVYIAAGTAKMNGYHSNMGRDLATSIVSGAQLLKNKQLILPSDDKLKSEFSNYIGQSMNGTQANSAFEVFKAVYADTLDKMGVAHADKKDSPNKTALEAALSMSTGGIYEQGGSFKNYLGGKTDSWKVTKPYGMDDSKFESYLTAGYKAVSQATGINESDLKSFRLRQSSVRSPQGEFLYDLINERGNPLVVKGNVWRIRLQGRTK